MSDLLTTYLRPDGRCVPRPHRRWDTEQALAAAAFASSQPVTVSGRPRRATAADASAYQAACATTSNAAAGSAGPTAPEPERGTSSAEERGGPRKADGVAPPCQLWLGSDDFRDPRVVSSEARADRWRHASHALDQERRLRDTAVEMPTTTGGPQGRDYEPDV